MKNFKMISALTEIEATVINPNGEMAVDLMISPNLPWGIAPPLGVPLPPDRVYGLIGPGDSFGDELTIRIIPQRYAFRIEDSIPEPAIRKLSNQSSLVLLGIPPALNSDPLACFTGLGAPGEVPMYQGASLFFRPLSDPERNNPDPSRIVVLRWTGTNWFVIASSGGIYLYSDPDDVIPA